MEKLTYEETIQLHFIYDSAARTRERVLAGVKQLRRDLDPANVEIGAIQDSAIRKLEAMSDEEFDALGLFDGIDECPDDDDSFKSVELLRCPRCGRALLLERKQTGQRRISADGMCYIRLCTPNARRQVYTQELLCMYCSLRPRWTLRQRRVVLLEGPDRAKVT